MSGEKWTPGPWIVDFESCDEEGPLRESEFTGYILDANGTEVCSRAFPLANAHLIAAAPEMYEALCAVDEWENPSCFEKVKAALKKARGEA